MPIKINFKEQERQPSNPSRNSPSSKRDLKPWMVKLGCILVSVFGRRNI